MLDNLDELRTFLSVAQRGSISGAARHLGLSVNATSRRLAQLEERLGVRLAERSTRSLSLTEEGLLFLPRCENIVGEAEEAADELRPASLGLSGLVRLATHPELLQLGLLQRIARLLREHPSLRIAVMARNSVEEISPEAYDLVVWPGEVNLQSVVAQKVVSVRWVLCCSPEYAQRFGLPNCPQQLSEHSCLRAIRDRREVRWLLLGPGDEPTEVEIGGGFESDDTETLRCAVYAGIGIGVRPLGSVERDVVEGRLVRVLPDYSFREFNIHLVSTPSRLRLSRVKAVEKLVRATLAELA